HALRLSFTMLLAVALIAWAMTVTRAEPGTSTEAACKAQDVLGVERIVEVDTTDGPRLGNLQYKEIDFLEPGEVVLTFDDGPGHATTERVLEALARHCAKATFFMVGRMALAHPDLVKRVAALGHTVASHTWSHANLGKLSEEKATREIELGFSAVTTALGHPIAPFFRFPYLRDTRRSISHLEGRNLGIFSIDVDAYDYRSHDVKKMQNNILKGLEKKGKGILLFHDIQPATAAGLSNLLDELKARNFKIVHLVPKAPATTLATFDQMAAKEAGRRAVASARAPLSPRAVTWAMEEGEATSATVTRPEDQASLPWKPVDVVKERTSRRASDPTRRAEAERKERPSWKRPEPTWMDKIHNF
ncbi:MAG: polysaccharide deacetylase family protein, partial [Hyphomicrobiaceae bacterium]